jgi:hypothetical protein
MTFARTAATGLAVVGAFALGAAVGPTIHATRNAETIRPAVVAPEEAPRLVSAETSPVMPVRNAAPRLTRVPMASAEPVREQVKTILNRGTDVRKASEGFANAHQFMTVAYAAKNTEIPFMLLKHRVLNERKPLTAAIKESKPELDETAEAARARAEARASLARLPS